MRFLLFCLLPLCWLGCDPDPDPVMEPVEPLPVETSVTKQYASMPGVDPDLLSLDVYFLEGQRLPLRPVVIYVHGGGWAVGDKANQIDDKVKLFRDQDYLFVSTNYRLSPVNGGGPDRVKFPDHNQDVATAIRWVYDSIARYGGDPNRIALLGHSAGAHLVALTGTNPEFLEAEGLSPTSLRGVATIDTEGYDVGTQVAEGSALYLNAFGPDPEVHRRASPLFNLEAGRVTPRFFIGKRGTAARIRLANDFKAELERVGVIVQEVNGSVYTHAGINAAIGDPGEEVVTPVLLAFFGECFGE
ncbi:MAG: alpha/beta hydrolase [Bacteroidota bacterium]